MRRCCSRRIQIRRSVIGLGCSTPRICSTASTHCAVDGGSRHRSRAVRDLTSSKALGELPVPAPADRGAAADCGGAGCGRCAPSQAPPGPRQARHPHPSHLHRHVRRPGRDPRRLADAIVERARCDPNAVRASTDESYRTEDDVRLTRTSTRRRCGPSRSRRCARYDVTDEVRELEALELGPGDVIVDDQPDRRASCCCPRATSRVRSTRRGSAHVATSVETILPSSCMRCSASQITSISSSIEQRVTTSAQLNLSDLGSQVGFRCRSTASSICSRPIRSVGRAPVERAPIARADVQLDTLFASLQQRAFRGEL